jgi:hypothetical protein
MVNNTFICHICHSIVEWGSSHKLDDAIFADKMFWVLKTPYRASSTIGYVPHLSGGKYVEAMDGV